MRARVWNDNPHTDWNETFKGDKVHIPSGKFVEMEFYDANEFRGQFSPIRILPNDSEDPKSYKMIRIEKLDNKEAGEIELQKSFPCNLCKKAFSSEETLLKHSDATHADRVIVDEIAEDAMPKKKLGRPAKAKEASA